MKYYGQWDPPVDEVLYKNYFNNVKSGFAIEAGASDGVTYSNCKFFEELGWKVMNFEPSKSLFSKLSVNRPKSININAGISNNSDELIFNDVNCPTPAGSGNGSFLHSNAHLKELIKYNVSLLPYKVKTISYIDALIKFNINKVDLMCLDVEGYELIVLDGISKSNIKPGVMCIEYPYIGLNKIINTMKSIGYIYNFISYNNAFFSHKNIKNPFGETFKEMILNDDGSVYEKELIK